MIEIDPKTTTRAMAFDLWLKAPMPMVTFFKSFDIAPLVAKSKAEGLKLNMLLCYCIGRAATRVKEFYMLPVGDKLYRYDNLAVNTIVMNKTGEVSSCDIAANDDLAVFNADYLRLTRQVADTCVDHDLSQSHMVIGTSAVTNVEIDGAVGMYSGIFNNPFMIWGRYRDQETPEGLASLLKISFQFHHTQMDGMHAGVFLGNLEREIGAAAL